MSTMTDTIDIARLLVNGRVGLSFRKFDKQVKQWIKTHYKHMAPYFYTSKRENIGAEILKYARRPSSRSPSGDCESRPRRERDASDRLQALVRVGSNPTALAIFYCSKYGSQH